MYTFHVYNRGSEELGSLLYEWVLILQSGNYKFAFLHCLQYSRLKNEALELGLALCRVSAIRSAQLPEDGTMGFYYDIGAR